MKVLAILALPILFVLSVAVSALGGNTAHYQCKYVESVKVAVADHEKYTDAAYTIQYSDGTVGAVNTLGEYDGAQGLKQGAVCKTVFNWGFPYSGTNRNVTDQSAVRE